MKFLFLTPSLPPVMSGEGGHPERWELLPPRDSCATCVIRCPGQIWRLQQRCPQAWVPYPRQTAASEVHTHEICHNLYGSAVSLSDWLWDPLKPRMHLVPCWNSFQWFPLKETILCCSTSPDVKLLCLCLCAQSLGAAQADQGAVGGQDTDLARRTQRNAQVCFKLSTAHSSLETPWERQRKKIVSVYCMCLGLLRRIRMWNWVLNKAISLHSRSGSADLPLLECVIWLYVCFVKGKIKCTQIDFCFTDVNVDIF